MRRDDEENRPNRERDPCNGRSPTSAPERGHSRGGKPNAGERHDEESNLGKADARVMRKRKEEVHAHAFENKGRTPASPTLFGF
jgi:hypothetical protein